MTITSRSLIKETAAKLGQISEEGFREGKLRTFRETLTDRLVVWWIKCVFVGLSIEHPQWIPSDKHETGSDLSKNLAQIKGNSASVPSKIKGRKLRL